jgi:hypothetical protein
VGTVLKNNFARGAISGLGLVNVWSALAELADMLGGRHTPPDDLPSNPS